MMIGSDYVTVFIRNYAKDQAVLPGQRYVFTKDDIMQALYQQMGDTYPSLPQDVDHAIDYLVNVGVAMEIITPHARPRYSLEYKVGDFGTKTWIFTGGVAEVASAYNDLGDDWLIESMRGAGEESKSGGVADLEPPADRSWSPLPLERPDPELDAIVDNLGQLADEVRADNGYAAEHAAERNDVVVRLGAAKEYLRNASVITRSAVETYVVWPLRKLIVRFGPSAIGAASRLAWSIFSEWLKKQIGL